jgi:hypothetical protein
MCILILDGDCDDGCVSFFFVCVQPRLCESIFGKAVSRGGGGCEVYNDANNVIGLRLGCEGSESFDGNMACRTQWYPSVLGRDLLSFSLFSPTTSLRSNCV